MSQPKFDLRKYGHWQIERGSFAYEAYCRATGGQSLVTGATLPDFSELRPDIQCAWVETADAVCDRFGAIN